MHPQVFLSPRHAFLFQASARDNKKLAEKERKLLEKSVREKELALRDDDNVFDVSYENQGDNTADVVSATDIKVGCHLNSFKTLLCKKC